MNAQTQTKQRVCFFCGEKTFRNYDCCDYCEQDAIQIMLEQQLEQDREDHRWEHDNARKET